MIRAVIIEDEPLAAQFLKAMLDRTGKVHVAGIAPNGDWGLILCADHAPDAAFLDIHLPGPDGMELASHLAQLPNPPLIVFTTGHAARAPEAFRIQAVDYLLKPLDPAQVEEAVERLERRIGEAKSQEATTPSKLPALQQGLEEDRLPIKIVQDDITRLVSRWDILAALRRDRRTWIHTEKEEFATYYPLNDLLNWLGGPPFIRISREAIVNMRAIEEVIHYGDRLYQVRLNDRLKTCLDASRSGAAQLAALVKPAI